MAKLSQIRRLAILINKLSAVRYVPTDALVAHVENTLALYDNKDSNYSQRTMQRDFGLIDAKGSSLLIVQGERRGHTGVDHVALVELQLDIAGHGLLKAVGEGIQRLP